MTRERLEVGVMAAVVGAVLLIMVMFTGGQTSRVLSNVGSSVGGYGPEDPNQPPIATPEPEPPSEQDGEPLAAIRDDAAIVYTGTLDMVVGDVEDAVDSAARTVAAAGGYMAASERSRDEDRPTAAITYRIPADRWETTLDALRGLAMDVVAEETSSQEVTGALVDLEARIRNLRATEAALQAIFGRAEKIPEVLEVQRELTSVRGEIERLDGQRAELADRAAYGTLRTTFGIEVVAVVEAQKGWDAATEVDGATAALVTTLQDLATTVIWLSIARLPFLVFLAIVGIVGLVVMRRTGLIGRPREATLG